MEWLLPDGGPLRVPGAVSFSGSFGAGVTDSGPGIGDVFTSGAGVDVVAVAMIAGPPTLGGTTIFAICGHKGPIMRGGDGDCVVWSSAYSVKRRAACSLG